MGFITKTACFTLKAFNPSALILKRKIVLGFVFGALLASLSPAVLAINLGHLQINSKQGEPLNASIEVHSATAEELQGLSAHLYAQKDYEALKLNWESSLSNTRLELSQGTDGRLFIQILGSEPVAQSYVELFFELKWNSGQVNRQIGLLLDPSFTAQSAKPSDNESAPIVVNPGDSASKLLEPLLTEDASMEQMLLALLRANPKAFINGNVNLLRTGSTLSVPSASSAQSLSVKQARQELQNQNLAFQSYRQALLAKINASSSVELKTSQQKASGKVHDPKSAKSRSGDQLTLNPAKPTNAQELDKLSQQKTAQEQDAQLKELQNNIKELQALNAQDKAFSFIRFWNQALSAVQEEWMTSKNWAFAQLPALKTFSQWTLAPVVSGLLLALLVLGTIWRLQKSRLNDRASEEEGKKHSSEPKDWRDEEVQPLMAPSFEAWPSPGGAHSTSDALMRDPSNRFEQNSPYTDASETVTDPSIHQPSALDVRDKDQAQPEVVHGEGHGEQHATEPSLEDDRVKLAEDLWEIGQHHTAYAIAQEVYQQSSGREFERAKLWLESHAI